MKKILALVLALAMVALCAVASAASITVNKKSGAEYTETTTYNYYQVLKADIGEAATVNKTDGTSTGGTAAYYVEAGDLYNALVAAGAGNVFTIEEVTATSPTRYNFILKDGKTIDDILKVVAADSVLEKAPTGSFTRAADATSASSGEIDPGYYVIKSSLGSILAAQTLSDVEINEKNDVPSLDKEVEDPIIEIGQKATYTLTITIPANPANKALVVYDHMHNGLTLDPATITVTGTKADAAITGLAFVEDGYTPATDREENYTYYQATIPAASVLGNAGQTLVLTYTAEVNENAIVYEDEPNKAHLEYDDHSFATPEDEEKVKTLAFKLKKIDGKTQADLTGAEFSLWDAKTDGNMISLVKVSDGVYRVATPEEKAAEGFESAVIEAGKPQINGLDDKKYYVQEDKAPDGGYNTLTERIEIEPDTTAVVEHEVENNQGSTLPSTGGIGTTIFYILGGLLVVGAAVILVARRKAQD